MAKATTYAIHLDRDESGSWLARSPGVPGFHTYGRSLRQVKSRVREALGLWVDDADTAELEFRYHFPAEWRQEIRAYQEARAAAISAERQLQAIGAAVASDLAQYHGLSLRDCADLLGLSHQRIQQLVEERRTIVEGLSGSSSRLVEKLLRLQQQAHKQEESHGSRL